MTKLLQSPSATRYTLQGLLSLTLLGLIAWGITLSIDPGTRVQAQGADAKAREIEPAVYSHVQKLRRDAALSSQDMAAMGMTQAESEAVLTRLVDWVEQNEQQLAGRERAVYAAKRDLEDLKRLIRTGQASDTQMRELDTRRQAVQAAEANLSSKKIEVVRSAVQTATSKSTAWERLAALPDDVPRHLRHVSSIDDTRWAWLKQQAEQYGTEVEQQLSFSEKQAIAEARQRVATSMPGVLAAEEASLPVPGALREVEIFVDEE